MSTDQIAGLASSLIRYSTHRVVGFKYDVDDAPLFNTAPQGRDPHGWPRKDPLAIEQMVRFFETGDIVNTCGGPCVNEIPS